MGKEIRVRDDALQSVALMLGQGVDDYCAFELLSLSGCAPVRGSSEHDGHLRQALTEALSSFGSIMRADAAVVRGMGRAYAVADAAAAKAVAGG